MDLLQFTLNRLYLKSPITLLHNIKSNYKIFCTFFILLYIPYCHSNQIITLIVIDITIIKILRIPKSIINQLIFLSFPIILLILFSIIINYQYFKLSHYPLNIFYIALPVKYFNMSLINIKHHTISLMKIYNFPIIIPIFILRILLVSTLYLISIRLLFLTTNYETIILFFLTIINHISNKKLKHIFIISALSIQFLELVINKLNQIIISIQIRFIDNHLYISIHHLKTVIVYLLILFYKYISENIYRIASTLYTRNITMLNL